MESKLPPINPSQKMYLNVNYKRNKVQPFIADNSKETQQFSNTSESF